MHAKTHAGVVFIQYAFMCVFFILLLYVASLNYEYFDTQQRKSFSDYNAGDICLMLLARGYTIAIFLGELIDGILDSTVAIIAVACFRTLCGNQWWGPIQAARSIIAPYILRFIVERCMYSIPNGYRQ